MAVHSTVIHPAFSLIGEHPAERIMRAQALSWSGNLHGDPAPTRNQVAAVMHALADFTHNQHMLGDAVRELGTPKYEVMGEAWQRASGLGRYFHALGDFLEEPARG